MRIRSPLPASSRATWVPIIRSKVKEIITVIGAGSVVTKNCEKNQIYLGNPAKKIKRLTSKTKAQKIKFQDMKGRFLAIIKNKNDKKYVKKNRGFSKEEAASIGLTKCKEKFPNFSDLENNGCYVHYETIVNDFNS